MLEQLEAVPGPRAEVNLLAFSEGEVLLDLDILGVDVFLSGRCSSA